MTKTKKVKVVQVGNRLIITNGIDPLRYVDLETNKVHIYPGNLRFKFIIKIKRLWHG